MSEELVSSLMRLEPHSEINCGYPSLIELEWKKAAEDNLEEAQKSLLDFARRKRSYLPQALYVLASLPYDEGKFGIDLVYEGLKSENIWCNECAVGVLEQWENLEVAEKMLAEFHSKEKWLQEYKEAVLRDLRELQIEREGKQLIEDNQ